MERPVELTLALALGLFHLWIGAFGGFDASIQRGVHLGLAVLIFALSIEDKTKKFQFRLSIIASVLIGLSIVWKILNLEYLSAGRFEFVSPLTPTEAVLGTIVCVSILWLCFRAVGWVLPALVIVFSAYCFIPDLPGILNHRGYTYDLFLDVQFLTFAGIFGIPLSVSASYIALFILFGAFMERSGLGGLIIELANRAVGHYRGGPAKVAVISSAFTGTISGSAPANVMTTGSLTIPLMKKTGYPSHWAGAIEAAASTGGILMPPIMGSIAFLMAQFTGIPYITIAGLALIPALLYFFGVFLAVHWAALRHGIQPVEVDSSDTYWEILRSRGHLGLPLVVLIVLLINGYSPQYAVSYSIVSVLFFSWFRPSQAMRFADIADAFLTAGKGIAFVAVTTAVAGMIVGVFELTGLAVTLAQTADQFVVGLFTSLLLTMIVSLILGMGVPPSVSYIVQVAVTIPMLIGLLKMHGLHPETAIICAHFFVMYYASLAVLTPPDALASIAAAGIAKSPVMKTAVYATRVAFVAFIVPFLFVLRPGLLLQADLDRILIDFSVAIIAVFCTSVILEGYRILTIKFWDKLCAAAVLLLILLPLDSINFMGMIIGLVYLLVRKLWKFTN